ncbi:MAG: hypothetical protein JST66_08395 [Bacteroidetes bacterium]|nr:hypothetical protein [Bacteroidota bacterium]
MPKRHVQWLLAVFLLSLAVRWPQLGRPLSKNHEFATAQALVVMDVWWERGFIACHGMPAVTYPGLCDGEASGMVYGFMQRAGVRYYLSHLPLAYWTPYAMFSALGLPPSPVPLRIFNLLLHASTAYFLYRFLRTVFRAAHHPSAEQLPPLAAALYLLMPGPLWYHGNVYMSDMAVQLPWAWALAAGARFFLDGPLRVRRGVWFFAALSAALLTEWMGVFVAITFAGHALVRGWRTGEKGAFQAAGIIVALIVLLVGGMLACYAGIAGWHALGEYYTYRWADRGTFVPRADAPLSGFLLGLAINLCFSWAPLLLVLSSALFVRRRMNGRWRLGPAGSAWAWMLIPALVHLLLFLRYAGHEFAVLKLGFALCTASAMVLLAWWERGRSWGVAAGTCTVVLAAAIHTWINRPGDGTATGDAYAIHQERGILIARTARMDEFICVSGTPVEPPIMFYAHRNIQAITMEEAAAGRFPRVDCPIVWFAFARDGCFVRHIPAPSGSRNRPRR